MLRLFTGDPFDDHIDELKKTQARYESAFSTWDKKASPERIIVRDHLDAIKQNIVTLLNMKHGRTIEKVAHDRLILGGSFDQYPEVMEYDKVAAAIVIKPHTFECK